jgi:hypothetical protein
MNRTKSRSTVGLRLSRGALGVLRERGIFAQSAVSLEHQHLAKCYVIRGLESGGAAGDVGHYVTFAREDGRPAEYFCLVETIGVNGPHAVVLAPVLVRIEMLRKASTYELLISQHRPSSVSNVSAHYSRPRFYFVEFTVAWNWIYQERTNHEPVQSYRLSVLGVEMRSAYRDVFGRQFVPLRRR